MKNAVSGRTKTDLPTLYDELEGKLRSLESLGRTQEKYGDFLTPLLAKSGFGTPIRKRYSPTERVKPTELMTASALAKSPQMVGGSSWLKQNSEHWPDGEISCKPQEVNVE
ncbi:hypothetical protein TNCV_1332121 [Trichonephila clavipes]|nr:hypothetical protein TNCV_1332121 [Trichonephila clavipes]